MTSPPPLGPPEASREPHEHVLHGVRRPDPYHWMRDLTSPALLAHLDAERRWYESATGHLGSLVEKLRSEMTGRVPPTDSSVSWRHHGFSYYTVLPAGREYVQLLREIDSPDQSAPPVPSIEGTPAHEIQLLLDVNELVEEGEYAELGLTLVSPDQRLLAWSLDRDGDEVYELRFRDLETGQDLDEVVTRSYYWGGAWSADSSTFFYSAPDEAYRPHQLWRHQIGTPVTEDVMVLEEPDEQFSVNVRLTRSGRLILLWSGNRDTTEVWALDAGDPTGIPRSIGGRRRGVEYFAEHVVLPDGSDTLLLVTNDQATEFRLAHCPVPGEGGQDHTAWEPLRPEDPAERLERVDSFAGHVVVSFRAEGRQRLRILRTDDLTGPGIVLDSQFSPGSIAVSRNLDFASDSVLVEEQSYVDPPIWSDVSMDTGDRRERKRQEAPGHDPARYVAETMSFPSPDGTSVPASVVRRRDTPLDGSAPCLVYGYAAYESFDHPEWEAALPSLLDRGAVFVYAHSRGGGQGGRGWWLDGRLEHKQNTFTDHIAVADGLVARGLVDESRIVTRGLSAGGLLQGAVLAQRPDRWCGVVAEVPFVDVVTSMADASIPLTPAEWDEWGDPRRPQDFAWMLAYSPYDQLPPAGARPDLLVTGAVHDPRVMVSEPAKWVAALRESDPAWSPRCLFRVETGAGGHTGPVGRFAQLAYEAEVYAWVLERMNVTDS